MKNVLHFAIGAAVVAGTLSVSVPSSYANTCSTASPMGSAGAPEMGTQTRQGVVGSFQPETWWEHSTTIANRIVSVSALDGADTLEVYDSSCSATPICTAAAAHALPAMCTIVQTGLVKIRVLHDASGGPSSNYTVTALGSNATECSDGIDNDGDGWVDSIQDPHCTSPADNTEAQVHLAAYGHITVETNAVNVPKMTLSGVYADANKFTCEMQYAPKIQASCIEKFDPEVAYDCTSFILSARASSSSAPAGPGGVKGHLTCDTGNVLDTADATTATGTSSNNHSPTYIDLGTAGVVRCRAAGVNGATNATGAYTVDCYEPGVAWPFETVRDPRRRE